ncbi:MAG: hypothetical protein SGI87_00990 [Flavobacteriales bacterium]|nr:hypothetical protein [Flavobacteriales bacterium]
MIENDQILDQFDDLNRKPKEHWFWQILPALIFVIGIFMTWMSVPGATTLLLAAASFAVIRLTIRFFRQQRVLFEWFYYLGNVSLMIAISLSILHIAPLDFKSLGPAMILFALGILSAGQRKN